MQLNGLAAFPRLYLLVVAQVALIVVQISAQGSSFAATKFDLSPGLPEEDLKIAGLSRDETPMHVAKKKDEMKLGKKNLSTTVVPSTSTTAPPASNLTHEEFVSITSESSQSVVPPHAYTAPHARAMPITTISDSAQQKFTTVQQGQEQQLQSTSPNTQIPLLETKQPQQFGAEQHTQAPGSLARPLRADEWFQEDFDTKECTRDGESVAESFKRKFPRNLLRDGKEAVLAELLATRIRECHEKHDKRHWSRIDALVAQSIDAPATEREECVAGLIEEQIACMNVVSYSCQFIRPTYAFRLLPTRIIVQEARYAEDGADKCRKFVRKMSRGAESTTSVPSV